MKQSLIFLAFAMSILGCQTNKNQMIVKSPDKNIQIYFQLNEAGEPGYSVVFKEDTVVKPSAMGFEFTDQPMLASDFRIVETRMKTIEETWKMPWGEQIEVENNYNEMMISLQEKQAPKRSMNIYFRAYNDGIGFRYEFPKQPAMDTLLIAEENTEFKLSGNHKVWWIPGDWDIYEHLYTESHFSEINATDSSTQNLAQTHIPENAVNTPVTMRSESGLHISFHEAALTNYPGMTLKVFPEKLEMKSVLVGTERHSYKAKVGIPFKTPWRTIQIAEKATDLIASKLIVNLNEPNKLGDVSYFQPMKYNGIWWEMHLDKSKWDYASGNHGATTENAKRYIDFAAENDIGGVLIEGWNTGWENWIGVDDREGIFDFVTPYPDYDLHEVVRYAGEKGVEIIMHHETSAAVTTYEKQMDTAFQLMESLGIHTVKTGYVGKIIPKGEYHHGQFMVNHYRKVLKNAAKYNIAINAHEPIKATGIRRTYPNAISREGLRGQEFNAWASDGGNPPAHLPTVAFTRMLAGPIDFTPGAFNIKLDPYKPDNQVNTTIAQQLALYVVIYSPVQMACDLPEHYERNPAFQFIRDVGVDWSQTEVINGEVGEFVTIARKEKQTGNWFLGSITNEEPRELKVSLSFLDENKTYRAIIYKDAEGAHWDNASQKIEIDTIQVTAQKTIQLKLAPGGGCAISFIKT